MAVSASYSWDGMGTWEADSVGGATGSPRLVQIQVRGITWRLWVVREITGTYPYMPETMEVAIIDFRNSKIGTGPSVGEATLYYAVT
jgi:hypothetical protein